MKISPYIKFFLIFCISNLILINSAISWTGYDYDNKTQIEIEAGNLVRENLVIQFYDNHDDNYHTAKIIYMDADAGGTKIILQDLDLKKERTFFMEN